MQFTEEELRIIAHALEVAANAFDEDAKVLTEERVGKWSTLAPTFNKQALESRELAARITDRIG